MIDAYLTAEFSEDGMALPKFNCWGLVRAIRSEVFGLPLLPAFESIPARDKLGMTYGAAIVEDSHVKQIDKPTDGAIASVWRHGLCMHVGVCAVLDGRMGVVDIDRGRGAAWRSIREFEARYGKVRYHN